PLLSSVKILNLYSFLRHHDNLRCILWKTMFPSLEILVFNSQYRPCHGCEGDPEADSSDDDEDDPNSDTNTRLVECARRAMEPLIDCPSLRRIYFKLS